jgi:2-dehydro-3-deoxyphosphogalactonate aldolase
MQLESAVGASAVLAILRGIETAREVEIGAAVHAAGIRSIEVSLNSPDPLGSQRPRRRSAQSAPVRRN